MPLGYNIYICYQDTRTDNLALSAPDDLRRIYLTFDLKVQSNQNASVVQRWNEVRGVIEITVC